MKRRPLATAAGLIVGVGLLLGLAAWYYAGTQAFMTGMGALAAERGSELLGQRVEIGAVRVVSPWALEVSRIAVYDKQKAPVIKAESALIGFSFFGVLSGSPASAVRTVELRRGEAWLTRRADGSWNYEDLVSKDSEPSQFRGRILTTGGIIHLDDEGRRLDLTDVAGSIDLTDDTAMLVDAEGRRGQEHFSVYGALGEKLNLDITGTDIDIAGYLAWIPEGTLPETVAVRGGKVESGTLSLRRTPRGYRYNGQVVLTQGAARVWETDVEEIAGSVDFSDRQVSLRLSAKSAGQQAAVRGAIMLGAGEASLDLIAESDGLDPSLFFKESPFQGAVAFRAAITGTPSAPVADGELRAAEGTLNGYPLKNAAAKAVWREGHLTVHSLTAEALGGTIRGAGEFDLAGKRYDGTVTLTNIDIAALGDAAQGFSGRLSADLGFAGEGTDMTALQLYGSVSARNATAYGVAIPEAQASLSRDSSSLRLDYLSARLEGGGEIGLEGTISEGRELDFSFTASHLDLTLAKRFDERADMSGYAEISGTVAGDAANPQVRAIFSAAQGQLFKQPFRTLHGAVSGSLDGIGIESFSMENGNGVNWLAKGTVGFTGERRVQLQVDTMNVRMEDIAALVAPDQPITGEADNIITVTGTLDDPDIVGYVHFRHGSYRGYLLSGMDGDYTMKNGVLTLHDFHIFSPRVDMDLNGTVLPSNGALDLHVAVHDVDLARVAKDLPYPIEGHGVFDGYISGTIYQPAFDGVLDAPSLMFNGAAVTNGHGQVTLRGSQLTFDPFHFEQNGGLYTLQATADIETLAVNAHAEVSNGDVNALLAIANAKNDTIHGRVDGTIDFSGTMEAPAAKVSLYLSDGNIGGYPVDAVYLDGRLQNRVVTLSRLEGKQGAGVFVAVGTVDLDGAIAAQFSAKNIEAGLIPAALGKELPLLGTLDFEAQFGGTVEAPTADASLTVRSNGRSTAYDTLSGLFKWRGSVIRVEQLLLQKEQNGHAYKASAYGTVPLRALTSRFDEVVSGADQIDLQLSLEEADLGVLPLISPAIDWALGTTYGSLHVGGTLAAPSFDGAVGVKDGAVKLKALGVPITQLQLGVRFEDDTISVTGGSGRMGSGSFTIEGATRLAEGNPEDYYLTVEAKRLDIESSFYRGPLTGKIDLREGERFGETLPKLTAKINIDDALISIPTIPDSQGELPPLLLDVGVEVGKHTHFYSSRLYDIWLEGAFHYGGTTQHPQPSGAVSVLRGTVTYVQTAFKIREGTLAFNQVDSFLPSLEFQADARLNRVRIYLAIRGPIEAMEFHLNSSPEMSQEEILRLLTLRGAYRSGQDVDSSDMTASFLEAGLQMSFLNIVEDKMRDLLQLDEFQISQDMSDWDKKGGDNRSQEAYNIQIGKYISDKVMLSYTQGINHPLRRYSIRYDFNDRFSAVIGRNEDNNTWIGIESRISF